MKKAILQSLAGIFAIILIFLSTIYGSAYVSLNNSFSVEENRAFGKSSPFNGDIEQPVFIVLMWEFTGTSMGYDYCLDTIDNDTCDTEWFFTGNDWVAFPPQLDEKTTYYWQVKERSLGGDIYADSGNWWSFRTLAKPALFRKLSPKSPSYFQPTGILLDWESSSRAITYRYCIDTINNDSCDTTWVERGANTFDTLSGLDVNECYFWQVEAVNSDGATEADLGRWFAFCTSNFKSILLVDDDDNSPDIRSSYTAILDNLGFAYDVFDTQNSDSEPDLDDLLKYRTVIWVSGMEEGGFAGPGLAGENALGDWLNSGKCLLLSTQNYFKDKGLTNFMMDYLGVQSIVDDVGQITLSGVGSVFSDLGPFTIIYPPSNPTDRILPDRFAETGFLGNQGIAGITNTRFGYKTAFLGFPIERLTNYSDREIVVSRFLDWCNSSPTAINSGWRTEPVVQDGIIHPSEWSDAYHYDITMPDFPLPVILHFKNDTQTLYFAIENLNVIDNQWQSIVFYFDDNPIPSDAKWGSTTCGSASGEGGIWFEAGGTSYLEWTANGSCDWVFPVTGANSSWSLSGGHRGVEGSINLITSPLRASPGDRFLMKIGFTYMGTSQGKIPGLDWAWNDPVHYIYLTLGKEKPYDNFLPAIIR